MAMPYGPRFLTNTPLGNESLCVQAARESGFDVRFCREPIPYTGEDDDRYYNREALQGVCGSVATYEPAGRDHGPFWKAWDKLRAAQ